jgi:pimeloyl-ACP methyl ester carboxylesterase
MQFKPKLHPMKIIPISLRRLLLSALFLLPVAANAQVHPLKETNDELRRLFGGLIHTKDYLYDMSAHVTKPSLFINNNIIDTVDSETWYRVYWECFYMAYDTTILPQDTTIYGQVANMGMDTIPMGVMDFDFHELKPNALTSNLYFIFDTINDILYDIPGRPEEPYLDKNLFVSAPLFALSTTNTVVYMVSPAFIFKDGFNSIYYSGSPYVFEIDFGDGKGFIQFDPTIVTYHPVYYPAGQTNADIITRITVDGMPVKISRSELTLGGVTRFTTPSYSYSPAGTGLSVGVFGSCANPGDEKIVIYLSGFNPLDFIPKYRRTPGEVYDNMIKNPELAKLRNFGYEFHIVTWGNSRQDLRGNGLSVVKLIDYLKQAYGTDHQFIIIGESMGGLIARYAMCFMEGATYQDPFSWPWGYATGYMHNTRELITFDTPHQGANIPLAIQFFYDDAMQGFGFLSPMSLRFVARMFNLFLDGVAAKQMLIYHIDTQSGTNFDSHQEKYDFFADLASMGNYPQFSKKIALSNGSLEGIPQMRFYDTNDRAPNDKLMNASISLYASILWNTVPIFDGHLTMLTNPNGYGMVYDQAAGFYKYRIRLRFFGVGLVSTFNPLTSRTEYADVLPICTSPGGYEPSGLEAVIGNSTSANSWQLSRFEPFNLFAYETGSDGNGCWNLSAHVGVKGFLSVNTSISICSDGFNFCFVPIQSALDYGVLGVSPTLFHDIASDPHTVKFGSTPFDVISGISVQDAMWMKANMPHMYIKYEHNEGGYMSTFFPYMSCPGTNGHWLNREIGDEVLYLDNLTVNWSSNYESYDYLLVNAPGGNPAYDYGGGGGNLNGIYSRNNPFQHNNPTIFSTFICNTTSWPLHYYVGGLNWWEYNVNQTNGINCCIFRMAQPQQNGSDDDWTVYPNPAGGNSVINISLTTSEPVEASMEIMDLGGRRIIQTQLGAMTVKGANQFSYDLSPLGLSTGVYFIRVKAGTESYLQKIVIQ